MEHQNNESHDINFVIQALKRCDEQIAIEFDLISARLSWLTISQSFMFAAFTNLKNLSMELIVAAVGLVTCYQVYKSVRAATRVIKTRKSERAPIEDWLNRQLNYLEVYTTSEDHRLFRSVSWAAATARQAEPVPKLIPLLLAALWLSLMLVKLAGLRLIHPS